MLRRARAEAQGALDVGESSAITMRHPSVGRDRARLAFAAWQPLVHEGELHTEEAIELMSALVAAAPQRTASIAKPPRQPRPS
jgi:hypothetical protein